MAFVASATNEPPALWIASSRVRQSSRRLAGTEDASRPFWSPDSRFIGFAAEGRLKKLDANTGTMQTICICVTELMGATWSESGVIVFGPFNRSPLHRVAAAGGTVGTDHGTRSRAATRTRIAGRTSCPTAATCCTPRAATSPSNTGVYLMDLETGTRQWLLEAQSQAMYVASGHLLFVRDGTLLAQPFRHPDDSAFRRAFPGGRLDRPQPDWCERVLRGVCRRERPGLSRRVTAGHRARPVRSGR